MGGSSKDGEGVGGEGEEGGPDVDRNIASIGCRVMVGEEHFPSRVEHRAKDGGAMRVAIGVPWDDVVKPRFLYKEDVYLTVLEECVKGVLLVHIN